jgi:hypothetical protein
MNVNISLLPQITMTDLLNATKHLNVDKFTSQVAPVLDYVGELPPNEVLVRTLQELELPDEAEDAEEWFDPYLQLGVDWDWYPILYALRVRGEPESSLLVPDSFYQGGADYVFSADDSEPAFVHRQRRISNIECTPIKTLGVHLELGSWNKAWRLPADGAPDDALVFELADVVARRIRPTLGGAEYLAETPDESALAVLAATVATLLSAKENQRHYGRHIVLRQDAYEAIFQNLGLRNYFTAARRILEVNHPHHLPTEAAWPPGEGTAPRRIAVLERKGDHVALIPGATSSLKRQLRSPA